jgi:hypothetical protein
MITELDLRYLRDLAVQAHQTWKAETLLADKVYSGDWEVLWPDGSVEQREPLVENTYALALEDKVITAAAIPMQLFTPPTRGTRNDEGEKNAQKRKRVGHSYHERSDLRRNLRRFYRDSLHTGLMVGMPWATGLVAGPAQRPPEERFAYFQAVNPRHVYPLGWDNRGRLTAAMVMRQKRIADMEADWGKHPALTAARFRHAVKGWQLHWVEEIWYFDSTQWGVAIGDANLPATMQGSIIGPADAQGSMIMDWLVAPAKHELGSCPLKAAARITHNDSPRGALIDIIPQLKLAQNFMARLLDDLQASIYAPIVLDNIKNPHEYGLGAVLIGTGAGKAFIDRDRPPVNFEAQQTVQSIMEQTRRQAMEPSQRSGEAGASIVSGKGVDALLGTFNAELAAAQADCEILVGDLTSSTAAMDEQYCFGEKQINVLTDTGEMRDETYDPAKLFKGDHRFSCSYGDRTGLNEQQYLTRIAMVKNLDGLSTRHFMEKTGMVPDPLAEETDKGIEKLVALFTDLILPQEIQAGNKEALVKFIEKVDTDKMTMREAVYATIRETSIAPAEQPGVQTPAGRADIMRMVRSLEAGGIPGSAEGMPPSQIGQGPTPGAPPMPGPPQLPPQIGRQLAQTAPGGTAT